MSVTNPNLKRVTMYMSKDLLERIDAYGSRMGINRTAAISSLAGTALDEKDAIRSINGAVGVLANVKE